MTADRLNRIESMTPSDVRNRKWVALLGLAAMVVCIVLLIVEVATSGHRSGSGVAGGDGQARTNTVADAPP